MGRLFNAKFTNELEVPNETVVEHGLWNDEGVFPPVSFQIEVADLDFHLFNIGHGSIS